MFRDKKRKKHQKEDILLEQKKDRRSLPNVPDPQRIRSASERRGNAIEGDKNYDAYIKAHREGVRYSVNLEARIFDKNREILCQIVDISSTGALISVHNKKDLEQLQSSRNLKIDFKIEQGSMPEGYEMSVKQKIRLIRFINNLEEEKDRIYVGIQFEKSLSQYAAKGKDRMRLTCASMLLLFITSTIVLMRAESIIYFKFNKWLYLYSIIAAVFLLSRYLFAIFYRPVPIDNEYTPGVTIVIPCFNEETWIERTIMSCVNQDYPIEALEVLVVDDCSTDRSAEVIQETIKKLVVNNPRLKVEERVRYIAQSQNGGKREALASGIKQAKHELIVFVDSDSFLDVFAIRNLVQPFQDPRMGGVSGRTDIANTYTNALTKMQAVRYYIAFRVMKAAEAYFDGVTCLSGPLACYRRSIIIEHMDEWLNQKFLGQKATFGDDRSMTNFVLRHHRTSYQDTAICSTIVPNNYKSFLKQQMRWKRSWLRESIIASTFLWYKEPFMAVFFYIGVIVPIAAPIVVLYNFIWIPIMHRVFPTTFIIGLLLMSFLMSGAQLFLRKSSTWLYGLIFCLYYELVLLWQMPIAWVTFWKSTWGTRMTPEDVREAEMKKAKAAERKRRFQKERSVHIHED